MDTTLDLDDYIKPNHRDTVLRIPSGPIISPNDSIRNTIASEINKDEPTPGIKTDISSKNKDVVSKKNERPTTFIFENPSKDDYSNERNSSNRVSSDPKYGSSISSSSHVRENYSPREDEDRKYARSLDNLERRKRSQDYYEDLPVKSLDRLSSRSSHHRKDNVGHAIKDILDHSRRRKRTYSSSIRSYASSRKHGKNRRAVTNAYDSDSSSEEDLDDEMSPEEERDFFISKFRIMRRSYKEIYVPKRKDLEKLDNLQLRMLYEGKIQECYLDANVINYKIILGGIFMAIEWASGKFLKINMSGYSKFQSSIMNKYDRFLIELGERDYGFMQNWSVEVRLMIAIAINTVIFFVAKMIYDKSKIDLSSTLSGLYDNFSQSQDHDIKDEPPPENAPSGLGNIFGGGEGGGGDLGSMMGGIMNMLGRSGIMDGIAKAAQGAGTQDNPSEPPRERGDAPRGPSFRRKKQE